ncbi:hypothetical protein CTI12_AA535370 [Artemisia annua]|uniref:Peptidase S8/S53 domain-containing protein n=1 Tax=Artemisia annua TaxID=35608 RepID=A0A2U1L385_ARTAN|nr:hypothetical protein CTI12_AA535370 [Artemisia annua]
MAYSATYIVHMNSSAMPKPYWSPHSWYLATLQSVSDQSFTHISTEKLIYSYTHAIQGFSATLTSSEHEKLEHQFSCLITLGNGVFDPGGKATRKISFHLNRLGTVPAPMVSEFSSRGPPHGLPVIFKPDPMAPGQQILASWPYLVNRNIDSGTSMACPHTSGLAAILKAAHPDWSPAAIRSAMMTTSSITDNNNNPLKKSLEMLLKKPLLWLWGLDIFS